MGRSALGMIMAVGRYEGLRVITVHKENEKYAKVTLENNSVVTALKSCLKTFTEDVAVVGKDGKERLIHFNCDGTIQYSTIKNGKSWGECRYIRCCDGWNRNEFHVNMPKWITEETTNLVLNKIEAISLVLNKVNQLKGGN